ncbi:MAG TPA: aminoacetone oxidase family FAD-binding enzyme [Candidatus Wallbacteria bacterium]|nr:aminoacetone oxidase family FAD-binding enzyme [Candidatus Wallbacteria bacterium]
MEKRYDIAVIGSGSAAGFLLSYLKESRAFSKIKIIVLEKNIKPFRKIDASGNGRCNFSNLNIIKKEYFSFSATNEWKEKAFEAMSGFDLAEFLSRSGIPSYSDEYGRLFPYTNSARTVSWFLEKGFNSNCLDVRLGSCVSSAVKNKTGEGFSISWRERESDLEYKAHADILVFAAGGSAYPQLGTDGSAFSILKGLGHGITRMSPGIVPLKTKKSSLHELSGIKSEVCLSFKKSFKRNGEILFTDYGISGPNVLYASNFISMALAGSEKPELTVDFFPEKNMNEKYFEAIFNASDKKNALDVFGGVLNHRLLKVLIGECFNGDIKIESKLQALDALEIYRRFKSFRIPVESTMSFREAQVSIGGCDCGGIEPSSFESNIHKNLYIIGEALDYTGGCGGFNIQQAAATARSAFKSIKKRREGF